MSFIMGRGDEAKKALGNEGGGNNRNELVDGENMFIRLKAGDSVRVRVLSPTDFVTYLSHNHFMKGINTQPCIKPVGERCLLCEAANYKGEEIGGIIGTVKNRAGADVSEWAQMYAKKRTLFAFVDLDTQTIRIFDATKNQADSMIATIEEYADDLDEVAFTLKRAGNKSDTSYTLNPITAKKFAEVEAAFNGFDNVEVEDKVFEDALQARTTEEQAQELRIAGFPLTVIGYEAPPSTDGGEGQKPEEEAPPQKQDGEDISEDDLPF